MEDGDPLSFLGDRYHRHHRVRALILAPGDAIDFQPGDWSDALVVVEHGHLQVECNSGARAVFGPGAVLVLTLLELRRLRSVGTTALVVTAVSRLPHDD
jgi:mannose-6-phosphate isomerase-like protein (cupin superfamily)